jgi:hypothetical protein
MAENIYSKGTRVWVEDKDQAWISAEVFSVTKGSDDSIKLVFVDERGKVLPNTLFSSSSNRLTCSRNRKSSSRPPERKSKMASKVYHPYAIPLSWKRRMISPLYLILTNHLVS